MKITTGEKNSFTSTTPRIQITKPMAGLRCYSCPLGGHIARDCTQPRQPLKCVKCKADGHTAKYCKANVPNISLISPISKEQNMQYIKEVRINNYDQPINGLIDTGRAYTIIRRSFSERFALHIVQKKTSMWVYRNTQVVTSCGEVIAEVNIDEVRERITLIVLPDSVQKNKIIVRRWFTDCENVTFVKTKDQLLFAYNIKFPFQEEDNLCVSQVKCCAKIKQDIETIPAESSEVVKAIIDNQQSEVMLINSDDKEANLHKNEQIGVMRNSVDVNNTTRQEQTPITADMIQHGPEMANNEVNELTELLNRYRGCMAFNLKELDYTN